MIYLNLAQIPKDFAPNKFGRRGIRFAPRLSGCRRSPSGHVAAVP